MTARPEVFTVEHEPIGTALQLNEPRSHAVARPNVSAGEMLLRAIEMGTAPEQLTIIADLHERIETRQAKKDFDAAMAAFKTEARSIKHNKTANVATSSGGTFSYTYASLDEIATEVDPILARCGLSYRWTDAKLDEKGVMLTTTIIVSHVNGHSESSSFTLPVASKSAMSEQQKIGAANKFARRQTLEMALGLTTTSEDRDEVEADPTPVTKQQLTVLEDLIEESGADRDRFLKHMGVTHLAEIRANEFERAVSALEQKKRGRK